MTKYCCYSTPSKTKDRMTKIFDEAYKLSLNFKGDLLYRDCDISLFDMQLCPENEVKFIFSPISAWEFVYTVNWTKFSIKELNMGLSGVILDGAKNQEEGVFS